MTPLIPTTTEELHASTEAEFVALLKMIQVRSGLSVPKVALRAGLARSQGYSMLTRPSLPTKPEQIHRFAVACGLPEPHVSRVLELWAGLRCAVMRSA